MIWSLGCGVRFRSKIRDQTGKGSRGSHDREMACCTPDCGVRFGDHRKQPRVSGAQILLRSFLDGISADWRSCGRCLRDMPQGGRLQGHAQDLFGMPQ